MLKIMVSVSMLQREAYEKIDLVEFFKLIFFCCSPGPGLDLKMYQNRLFQKMISPVPVVRF
jgi:hypothetical protein